MITKEGVITIEEGKFFIDGFHFKGNDNFEDCRQDLILYIENILTAKNVIPSNLINVSDGYQEPGQGNK